MDFIRRYIESAEMDRGRYLLTACLRSQLIALGSLSLSSSEAEFVFPDGSLMKPYALGYVFGCISYCADQSSSCFPIPEKDRSFAREECIVYYLRMLFKDVDVLMGVKSLIELYMESSEFAAGMETSFREVSALDFYYPEPPAVDEDLPVGLYNYVRKT